MTFPAGMRPATQIAPSARAKVTTPETAPRTHRRHVAQTTTSSALGGDNCSANSAAMTAWTNQPATSKWRSWNRSAMTPAKGASSGGTACANSSNPTAVALPVAR
jgi:hypothetical protein